MDINQYKRYTDKTVLDASRERICHVFDNFNKIYLSFSGGKDSTLMFHLVMEEAIKRNIKIGVLFIDFEAQYKATIEHTYNMFDCYKNHIQLNWICLPLSLRNAVSNFEPRWICWDNNIDERWVRQLPDHDNVISDDNYFPFFHKGMEFEEFVILYGLWYGQGEDTACFVGIRADESLNRFRTIATFKKGTYKGLRYSTKIEDNLYNFYPIYDWRVNDIWKYHYLNPDKCINSIYELMHKAGVPFADQRLCQPYGDDQRKGLWLYHILEPQSWYKVVARVNGANFGALYTQETGNIMGNIKIDKPEGHTYKSFCNLLLNTLPKISREHYKKRFKVFINGWRQRGYKDGIPDVAPRVLENKHWAPSWRRLCKVLLRNDWWCKGLGLTQPKSEAYQKYMNMKKAKSEKPLDKG